MVPVEHTKWMASTWDCTLDPIGVHWTSKLPVNCSGVRFFTGELLWTVYEKLLPPPIPPANASPTAHPPYYKIDVHLQKIT